SGMGHRLHHRLNRRRYGNRRRISAGSHPHLLFAGPDCHGHWNRRSADQFHHGGCHYPARTYEPSGRYHSCPRLDGRRRYRRAIWRTHGPENVCRATAFPARHFDCGGWASIWIRTDCPARKPLFYSKCGIGIVSALLRYGLSLSAGLFLQCAAAAADELVTTIEPSRVLINSAFSGSSVIAFGAIKTPTARARSYDVVVVVSGPRRDVVIRKKDRVAGIWINQSSRTFPDIAYFLKVFANRPLDAIADADTLRINRIGLKNSIFASGTADESDAYIANLVKTRIEEGLYSEQTRGAVTFLSPTVFRVDIPLPKSVMTGVYRVETKLFADGIVLTQNLMQFEVEKVGVEALVVKASVDNSLAYGLAA